MTATNSDRASQADAFLAMMASTGLTLTDLTTAATAQDPGDEGAKPVTVTQAVAMALEAIANPQTRSSYRTYFRLMELKWWDRPARSITTNELKALQARVHSDGVAALRRELGEGDNSQAVRGGGRARTRAGLGSARNFVAAARNLFSNLVDAGELDSSPAAKLKMPRKAAPARRRLTENELTELWGAVPQTADPELARLIIRFHLETAARRGGALALRLRDLRPDDGLVVLHEKGGTKFEQPVSRALMGELQTHAHRRGARAIEDHVLRRSPSKAYPSGRRVTAKVYELLFAELRGLLGSWAQADLSARRLRHTAVHAIRGLSDHDTARLFARHAGPGDTTGVYAAADSGEALAAFSLYVGEIHPLVPSHLADQLRNQLNQT